MDTKFNDLALDLACTGKLDLQKYGLEYRKGKTSADVKRAMEKARDPKNGHAKIEMELSMLEIYLKGVFKGKPKEKINATGS